MDLTGSEEAPRVYAVLTRLSPEAAYREGIYCIDAGIKHTMYIRVRHYG